MIEVVLPTLDLGHLESRLCQVFESVGWRIRHIGEHDVERVLLL